MKTSLKGIMHWIWTKQKAVLITLSIYFLVILVKHLMISNLDDTLWYPKPLIEFMKLVEIIALLSFLAALVSQIRYAVALLTTLLMTLNLLVAAEATFCILYEWENRPGNEENLNRKKEEKSEKQRKEAEEKKHASENLSPQKPPVVDPQPVAKTIQTLDLFEISDSEKVAGEPEIRKEEPSWGERQKIDDQLGFMNKPNSRVEVKSWSFGKPNPKAFYTIDSLGRRVTGIKTGTGPDKKYALFFGCSVTFGLWVNDDQTLPAFFEGMDTNFHAYNYGVSGYGAHHLPALFESRNLRKEIPERDGIAIYSYFIGHTQRAIGDMESYLSWNATSPYYYLKGDEVIRDGSFKSGRRFVSWFYEFISKTYFCRYYELKFPGELKARHYRLAAKIIEKGYLKYKEQFGNDNFYIVLLPGWNDEMKTYLDELHLKTIDCTNFVSSYWQDKYYFKGDGHPRPLFYKILAEHIHKEIVEKKNQAENKK
jgi:hypothetical protein